MHLKSARDSARCHVRCKTACSRAAILLMITALPLHILALLLCRLAARLQGARLCWQHGNAPAAAVADLSWAGLRAVLCCHKWRCGAGGRHGSQQGLQVCVSVAGDLEAMHAPRQLLV
jgi:hypothetical protein